VVVVLVVVVEIVVVVIGGVGGTVDFVVTVLPFTAVTQGPSPHLHVHNN
jgi:hypothetical protein